MSLISTIKADLQANKGNSKGKFIVVFFRVAHAITQNSNIIIRILGFPLVKIYHWLLIWLMGVEIPTSTMVGAGLQVWHGVGLVINPAVVIGSNVLLRQSTTIGNKYMGSPCPRIGNNVHIGAHTIIIGDIEVGDNCVIGAGTVVTKSIPANSIAYGNPMIVKPIKSSSE